MKSSFENLSPELVQAIITLIELSSWKILRLVNKTLAAHVTPLMFRDVEAWIQTQSLKTLVSIARNKHVAPFVQNLTLTNDYLTTQILHPGSIIPMIYRTITAPIGTQRGPSWIDATTAQNVSMTDFAEFDIPEQLTALTWDREKVWKAWILQRDMAIEQDDMITKSLDVEYLAEALRGFTNLTCIKLASGGVGGPRKVNRKLGMEIFLPEPDTRSDGRQLISLFQAAATIAPHHLEQHPKLNSLIMDENFWEEGYHKHLWLDGPLKQAVPDLGSLDPGTARAALPAISTIKSLVIQAQRRKSKRCGLVIEQNLEIMFSGLPVLEHLTLYNRLRMGLLRMHRPIEAIASTTCRSVSLQGCVLHMTSMTDFLRKQADTLKHLRLETIGLEGGHVVDFFTHMRTLLTMDLFHLKGSLVEVEREDLFYLPDEEHDERTFDLVKARRNAARNGIESYAKRETNRFPAELLDIDTSSFADFTTASHRGMRVVIGASRLSETDQTDY